MRENDRLNRNRLAYEMIDKMSTHDMRKALEDYLGINFIPISEDPQITGAIGAAIMAKEMFLS